MQMSGGMHSANVMCVVLHVAIPESQIVVQGSRV